MVSVLDFRSGGRWFEPGHCHRVVSLDKKLYSPFSLHPIIMMRGNLTMDWHPIQAGVAIFPVASCCRNRSKKGLLTSQVAHQAGA